MNTPAENWKVPGITFGAAQLALQGCLGGIENEVSAPMFADRVMPGAAEEEKWLILWERAKALGSPCDCKASRRVEAINSDIITD